MRPTTFHVALLSLILYAQIGAQSPQGNLSQSPQKAAAKLLDIETKDAQALYLQEHPSLVSPELTQLFLEQARKHLMEGDLVKAMKLSELADLVADKNGDARRQALAWTVGGNIHRLQGRESLALDYLFRALPVHEKFANDEAISSTLFAIGYVQVLRGDYALAETSYQRLFSINEKRNYNVWLARSLGGLGAVYWSRGEFSRGLEAHQKSLAVYESAGDKFGIAFALHGLGNAYRMLGDYESALRYLRASLDLSEVLRINDLTIRTSGNIAALYRSQRDHAQAIVYSEKCLRLSEQTKNEYWTVISLLSLGEINRAEGNSDVAKGHFEKALVVSEANGYKDWIVVALFSIGELHHAESNHQMAKEFADRAIAISRQTGGREWLWRALTTGGKAGFALGNTPQASAYFSEAIDTIESVRSGIVGQEMRAAYFATAREPYEHYVDLLMQQHVLKPADDFGARAFQTVERARARSLVDLLSEARTEIRQGVDADLLARERALKDLRNAKAAQLIRGPRTGVEFDRLSAEIENLNSELQKLSLQIRQVSPRYAALTHPQPLTADEIRRDLLDSDTVLLEYSLGDARELFLVGYARIVEEL